MKYEVAILGGSSLARCPRPSDGAGNVRTRLHATVLVLMLAISVACADQPADPVTTATPFLQPGEAVQKVIHGRVHVAMARFPEDGVMRPRNVSALYFVDVKGNLLARREVTPRTAIHAWGDLDSVVASAKYVAVKRNYLTDEQRVRRKGSIKGLLILDMSGKTACELEDVGPGYEVLLDDDRDRFMLLQLNHGRYEIYTAQGKRAKRESFSRWDAPDAHAEGEESPIYGTLVRSGDGKLLAICRLANLGKRAFYELTLMQVSGSLLFQKRVEGLYGYATGILSTSRKVFVWETNEFTVPKAPRRVAVFSFAGDLVSRMTSDDFVKKYPEMQEKGR